jgi:hypothetical protein
MDIAQLRRQAEQYRAVLELDKFDLSQETKELPQPSLLASGFAHLRSRESLELVKDNIQKAQTDALENNDTEKVRLLTMFQAWLIQAFIDHEVREIDHQIAHNVHHSTVTIENDQSVRLSDARLLLPHHNEKSRAALNNARVQTAASMIPLLAERLSISHGIARSFHKENFLDLWSDTMGVDVPNLKSLAEDVLSGTDEIYQEVLGWTVRKRLGCSLEDAHRRDMPFIFAARYTKYAESYTVRGMVNNAREFLSRMGIQLNCEGRLTVVINESRRLPHRAFVCAPRIPDDVRILLQAADGQRDLARFLAALGRGLFLASIDPNAPFEDRVLGDGALDLTFSRIFQDLLLDPKWLKRSLGVTRNKDYLILAYLERLYDLRLVCGRVLYELELYQGGTIDGMKDRYTTIFKRAIGVQNPPELFLHEVRKPFLSAFQLRARLFEALYSAHLKHYFNADWWQNPQAGPFLKKDWSQGRKLDVDARTIAMGYDGLSAAPLKKLFMQNF